MNNFFEQFGATAERFASRPAVEIQRRDTLEQFTYAELRGMAERTAAFLCRRGLAPGERAAILADNDARWCAAYLGVLRLGGVAVPFDTAYRPKQIAALLRDSSVRILFVSPRYLAAARQAKWLAGTEAELVLLYQPPPEEVDVRDTSFDQILVQPAPTELPPCRARLTDPAVILYTSGTTSDPKGVVLTHGNLLAEGQGVFQVIHVDERDAILGVLPLFHALAQMANLLLPFWVGARVVFLETVNSTELLRALRERGITVFCCVPQFFYLIHERVTREVAAAGRARRLAFRTLLGLNGWLRETMGVNLGPILFRPVHAALGPVMRLLVTGGSRLDPTIGHDLYRLGFNLLQAYGLTESSGAATVTRPGDKYSDSVGPPLPGVEVEIAPWENSSTPGQKASGNGAATPPRGNSGNEGEILLRGPIVMQGYFNRPDANAEALAGGWLHTGDLGYLDSAGRLHITGRCKEIIVLSSGKNLYPEEIEAHYSQSSYIKELCVMGRARPDEPVAERLHAVVVPDFERLRERKVLNTREVLRFEIEGLSIHLPGHKRILSYEIWTEELPRTTTRKLRRFEIERRVKERAATEQGTDERAWTEDELAWAARPEVAAALELIRTATKAGSAVRPDANIELDLGLDSMERVELLMRLEQLFSTIVPEEVAHRIYTVRELVAACLPTTSEAAPLPGESAAAGDSTPWDALLENVREDDPELAGLLKPRPVFAAASFVLAKLGYALARLVFRMRVTGRENLPARGPFLLCPNHQSYLDAILLVSALPFRIFREVFLVGASEYFATPFTRWVAQQINLIPVDPDANLLRAMQAGAFGLRHGKVLVLFPEGERSIDGAPKKFKKGASILSLHLRAPIVPVAMDGVFEVWPRGRSLRWFVHAPLVGRHQPGLPDRISIHFGAPLPPVGEIPGGASLAEAESHYAAAADQLRSIVAEMWHALRPRNA